MLSSRSREPYDGLIRFLLPVVATLCIIAFMVLIHAVRPIPAQPAAAPTDTVSAAPASYRAGVQDDRLVIYTEGEPVLVTEILVSTLPAADQKRLRQGITLADEIALAKLLEDYGS